jgi:hypothetical protein
LVYFSLILYLLAEDENPSKAAKVDIPSAQLVGGMVPGPLGAGYPPRPLAAMQPMYFFSILYY